jgi:hypothetical protein
VVILQKSSEGIPNYRRLQVVKNRYDGTVGETAMAFNPKTKRYFEMTPFEKSLFIESKGDIKKLCEARINKYGVVEPAMAELTVTA